MREAGTEYRELTAALAAVHGRAACPHAAAAALGQTALPELYDPIANVAARPPSFSFSNGAYCVKNAAGLELRGRIGGSMPVEKIAFGGKDYGRFSAMIQTQGAFNSKSRSGYGFAFHGGNRLLAQLHRMESFNNPRDARNRFAQRLPLRALRQAGRLLVRTADVQEIGCLAPTPLS